ncbi:MAG: 2,3-diaminopropionate biosynthesis protein SbnB [Gemmatimonadota bacterium]
MSEGADDGSVLIVTAGEVSALLDGEEDRVIGAVREAYVAHGRGQSSLPHSTFLRFPDDDTNRVIALPAYLGGSAEVAGVKWIASFPANVQRGAPRASAVLVLNSPKTGRPQAILEGSVISARRTAASAALAASVLTRNGADPPEEAGLVGTGVINLEVARFLLTTMPSIRRFMLFDLDAERARAFGERLSAVGASDWELAPNLDTLLRRCPLTSFATTALEPHVEDLSLCPPGATVLHVSLRDLTPRAILAADNVVDDPDHVCRAQTSVHLAEQETGSREFIRCTLAEVLEGDSPPRPGGDRVTVFSPFGLGVLDLALGDLVLELAAERGVGTAVPSFLPAGAG